MLKTVDLRSIGTAQKLYRVKIRVNCRVAVTVSADFRVTHGQVKHKEAKINDRFHTS